MSSNNLITPSDLPLTMKEHSISPKSGVQIGEALTSTLEKVEKMRIIEALKKTGWVQARAARLVGITSRQIGYKIKKYEINIKKALSAKTD